jgi:DNA-binding winged helix-turn-helix (wHTH) protein
MRYLIGQFEVDSDRYELRRDGSVEAVEPLVFNLILFLARNPNRVISRDEVIEAVWSGRTVSDATVASAIKSARRALGDSGDSQNYIRTVRGRGFEFQAEVLTVEHTKTSAVLENLNPSQRALPPAIPNPFS